MTHFVWTSGVYLRVHTDSVLYSYYSCTIYIKHVCVVKCRESHLFGELCWLALLIGDLGGPRWKTQTRSNITSRPAPRDRMPQAQHSRVLAMNEDMGGDEGTEDWRLETLGCAAGYDGMTPAL